jgi:membrane-bound lytic murein transglycosylase B
MYWPKHSFAPYAVALCALALGACSTVPEKQEVNDVGQSVKQQSPSGTANNDQPQNLTYAGKGVGNYAAASLGGNFAGDPRLLNFIEHMVQTQGFNRNYLYGVFSQVRNNDDVARLWANTSSDPGSPKGWNAYRDRFVTVANVQRGSEFWRQHAPALQRAQQQYGVPAEYIVGIMGIETRWGRILGKYRVIDALTTSALVNQRRSEFFFNELQNYLLMSRSERMDPLGPKGSFAGAMGYGQFMPSSFHTYAVDFNGDGVRDLWNPDDAIGCIANYFSKSGWQPGGEVAVPAQVSSGAYANAPDGYKVKYSMSDLQRLGVAPKYGNGSAGPVYLLALSTVPGGYKEPWVGYQNFYVITRYNHSNYYAMTVHLLAQAVRSNIQR